jgi:SAM-dependent methyltransferase
MQELIAQASVEELAERGVDLFSQRVLEIGAGPGGYSGVLRAASDQLVVSDINRHETLSPELDFVQLDATRAFPLDDNTFDFVYCSSVIEHLADPTVLLPEVRRVLRPRGRMLLSFPPFYSLFLIGGHQFKPWHLLGRRVALRAFNRSNQYPVSDYAAGHLYPLRISTVDRLVATSGLRSVATWTRLLPLNTTRLPGVLADLFTWHACWLLEKGADSSASTGP